MKMFAIRDESMEIQKDLAYLFYYKNDKRFYIEISGDADEWEIPLILSSFVKRGVFTINAYWSMKWVAERIVPRNRQNIGQILKDNGLKEYDEFELLMLAMGRYAQDDCYLVPLEEGDLPEQIRCRFEKRVEDIVPLENSSLLVFFRDGSVKKCSMKKIFNDNKSFWILMQKPELFETVKLQPGGFGVEWDINMTVEDFVLYKIGKDIPLSLADFKSFVSNRVVNVAETAEILDCTRQNIDYLTKAGKLHPVKTSEKNTLYLKSEVLQRNWR